MTGNEISSLEADLAEARELIGQFIVIIEGRLSSEKCDVTRAIAFLERTSKKGSR